jgi:hypothetical protein
MKRILTLAIIAPIAGCSELGGSGGGIAVDAAACAAALVAGGIANPNGIPALALSTPACTNLAKDALDAAIKAAQQQLPVAQRNARMVR